MIFGFEAGALVDKPMSVICGSRSRHISCLRRPHPATSKSEDVACLHALPGRVSRVQPSPGETLCIGFRV